MAKKAWEPKIEWRDPRTLTPYERNINVHSEEQILDLANSISNFGFDQAIVVDKNGVIIKGHCRRESAIRLALSKVPVVVADHLTEAQANASRIADKKTAEKSQWDQDMLKFELQTLDLAGFDLNLTGFKLPEVRAFLDEGEIAPEFFGSESRVADADTPRAEVSAPIAPPSLEPLPGEDEVPQGLPTLVKRGEIWTLGRHRIVCGDTTATADIHTLLEEDLNGGPHVAVITDPPFGIGLRRGKFSGAAESVHHGDKSTVIGDDTIETAMSAARFIISLNVPAVIWGANYFSNALPPQKSWIVWDKQTVGDVYADCELAWTSVEGRVRKFTHQWHGMIKASERGEARIHSTQKPIALLEWCIKEYAPNASVVIDLFGGSGSTLIACEKLGVSCRLMEIDPAHCSNIIRRWCELTGDDAERSDGVKFSDLLEANPT